MVKRKVKEYVNEWEIRCYKDGLPDSSPLEIKDLVPSYKRICMCILNNDLNFLGLGFAGKKSLYYSEYKRIEINERNKNVYPKQLKLF